MKLNNRQRAGALIAALAVAALGVDQFILGGTGPATAAAQSAAPTAENVQVVAQTGVPTQKVRSLAHRLDQFAAAEDLNPGGAVPDLFGKEQWKVQSVFGTGTERGGVRVGGKTVTIGGTHEGAKLVRVTREGAYFSRGGREFFIELDRPEPVRRPQSPKQGSKG